MRFVDGYLDASTSGQDAITNRTFRSFGYEWTTFDRIQAEDERFWQEYFSDVPLDELQDRVGLDAGCGKGRYSRFSARHLKALVALDGSDAVVPAARNLSDLTNVLVIKGDLRSCPFSDQSFGFISCLGVLHHLSDPEEGFLSLARLLAPGGMLLLYLYSRPSQKGLRWLGLCASSGLRRITLHMPPPALRLLAAPVAAALYGGVAVADAVGKLRKQPMSGMPLLAYRNRPLRSLWLDSFDRLSAPSEARFVWSDVAPWFTRAGLTVQAVSETTGLTILARRPSTGSP
jgi:SAM-dependent methyltransferase